MKLNHTFVLIFYSNHTEAIYCIEPQMRTEYTREWIAWIDELKADLRFPKRMWIKTWINIVLMQNSEVHYIQ